MKHEFQGTLTSYIIGFIFSILLTLAAYFLVVDHLFSSQLITIAILGLAVIQLLIQLLFFLHMGKEPKPYWNLTVLISFIGIILIIIIGSLWIMYHLNYNMTPDEMKSYMLKEEGMQK